ncbi:PREDICTED: uncharacterized protein LOC106344784 [Brassica oleracea var. oleracea]|uniref:uncharacterized protein LOC106344784 n=1 Tax=Brassica oleracea var. oleracea TaxID=109376 RepID=UPI0006A6D15E|nr:PREDICTED: uncharacterized protein LOC106344784 [Brassica oleracea var. oleracea]
MDDLPLTEGDQNRHLKIGSNLTEGLRRRVIDFLRSNSDYFAWSHADMPRIDPEVIMHKLQVDPLHQPVRQKRRKFAPKRDTINNDEVKSLLGVGFIRQSIEANQEKTWAIHSIPSPKNVKEVQKLTERMAALSRFISKLSDKSHAFFGTLKNPRDFQWTEECESAL